MGAVIRFLSWLVQKAAAAILIVVLGLAAYGTWLFLRDHVDIDVRRSALVMELTGERRHLQEALSDVQARLDAQKQELLRQQARVRQAARVLTQLQAQSSWWSRLFGDREQQRANDGMIARAVRIRTESGQRVDELRQQIMRTGWEKDGLEISLGRIDRQIRELEAGKSKVVYYLRQAWERTRWYVFVALGAYFLGPTLGKVLLYYLVAPLVSRRRPLRFGEPRQNGLAVGASGASLDGSVWPGETLWVREKFLQASDEGLRRKTRFLLDWRIPLTSLACGLTELIEMCNETAGAEYRVTFSNSADPHVELALVSIPEGASLILRPSFLAAVIRPRGSRLVIRRHWRLFRLQSWITLQLRHFEFAGPCRLVIAGGRGVRAEPLEPREGIPHPARRTNQDATIGFTPGLDYRLVRAETFWAYYRNMNPLFDDLFEGPGTFLCQEVSMKGSAAKARQFWSNVWGGVLKIFGV